MNRNKTKIKLLSILAVAVMVFSGTVVLVTDENGSDAASGSLMLAASGSNSSGQQGASGSSVNYFTARAGNIADYVVTDTTTWYIDNNGDLWGAGSNNRGQQGSGDKNNVYEFTKRASGVEVVVASATTTWYIDQNSDLWGCGRNEFGQQGSGDTEDVLTFTKRASNVAEVYVTDITTWYVDYDGDLYGCGANNYGQQGSGGTTNVTTFTLRASDVTMVSVTALTTWYIDNNGDLSGCGANDHGQQGSGGTTNVTTFTLRASDVATIVASTDTTWYIDIGGYLYGCGANNRGQQGSGNTTDVTTFTQRSDRNVQMVYPTQTTTWYVDGSGNLYGCGHNSGGQQGSGDTANVLTFTQRASNVLPENVSVSQQATFYIASNGDLYGCGRNTYGQQGVGNTSSVYEFTKTASGVTSVRSVEQNTWIIAPTYSVHIRSNQPTYGQVTPSSFENAVSGYPIVTNGNRLSVGSLTATASIVEETGKTRTFDGWFYNGQEIVSGSIIVGSNLALDAMFSESEITYTITWSINGTTETETYPVGAMPTHADPVVEGYTFDGWEPSITTVTGDQTYTAKLTPIVYTITWDANGGTVDVPTSTGSIEEPITAPTPTRQWYVFDGWFTEIEGGTQIVSPFVPTSNATYYAHWSPLTYTITLDANGGSSETVTVTGSPTKSATLPNATFGNKYLLGWFTDTTGGELVGIDGTIVYPTEDVTYHAQWSDVPVYRFAVNYNFNGGYSGPSASVMTTITESATHTFKIPNVEPKKDGLFFIGWSKTTESTNVSYKKGASITVNENEIVTLYAVWSEKAPEDYGWIKDTVPILAAVGIFVGAATIVFTSRGNPTEMIGMMIALALGVLMLTMILIPVLEGL